MTAAAQDHVRVPGVRTRAKTTRRSERLRHLAPSGTKVTAVTDLVAASAKRVVLPWLESMTGSLTICTCSAPLSSVT
jgi:hypothetical protein